MNYYERHIGDYARDTAHLTMLEHGAYTLLMDRYYATETGIPADQAHRLARARTRDEKAAVDSVLQEFFTLADGVWKKNRIEREIEKAQAKISAAQLNGKKGGRPRSVTQEQEKITDGKPSGFSLGSKTETQVKAHQTPDTSKETKAPQPPVPGGAVEPIKKTRAETAVRFDTFIERCRANGERAISDYKPVWDYAERAGIPRDYIELCWVSFRNRYKAGGARDTKRYTDWRKTFRNAVEDNWMKLWSFDQSGECFLTAQGRQAENATKEAA